nr:carboxypeptidase B [Cherax quadricarinatus]
MMKTVVVLVACVLGMAVARPDLHTHLYGAQVLRVVPEEAAQVYYLKGLQLQNYFDFWTEPRAIGSPVDIMTTAFQLPLLKHTLTHVGLEFRTMISNVGELVAQQKAAREGARASGPLSLDWTSYYDYEEIMAWLDTLATEYPELCTVEEVGNSYEDRVMKLLKLGKGGADKPIIFIDGGIHAREWIAPATVTYIVNELVTHSDTYDDLLSNVNFYVMPVINPDGYAYTFTDDRLWRKTRSPTNSVLGCRGADPNRNWSFHWNEVGASDSPCSDIYAGPEPFSEVEMRNVRDQINKYADNIKSYLTFHSYSQLWMYPWGYTSDLPEDWQDLDDLAVAAVEALTAVHGTTYEIGSSTNTIYAAAGGSDDWAKGEAGVKYSYTIELRDTGRYGFLLPEDQIIPTGEETFEGVKVVANFIRDTYSP